MDRDGVTAESAVVPDGAGAPPTVLSPSTMTAVRRALHAYREGWVVERELRRAARAVALDARRHDLPPERMLVAVKTAWSHLPEVRQSAPSDESRDFANRFFTLCIEEFFAATRAGRTIPPRAD